VPCQRCCAANNQSDRLIGKDAHKDVRRGDDAGGDRKLEARIDTAGDQYGRPAQNSDRDCDLPPPPEQQPDEEYGRNHVVSVRSRACGGKSQPNRATYPDLMCAIGVTTR
jgi:hypothetical protein